MPFAVGNQHGVRAARVARLLQSLIEGDERTLGDRARLRIALGAQLDRAASGDLAALAWIADRVDGRAKQQIDMDVTARLSDLGVLAQQRAAAIEGEIVQAAIEAAD